jgi:hypothetical protein
MPRKHEAAKRSRKADVDADLARLRALSGGVESGIPNCA